LPPDRSAISSTIAAGQRVAGQLGEQQAQVAGAERGQRQMAHEDAAQQLDQRGGQRPAAGSSSR
jgi:hypothetical protein